MPEIKFDKRPARHAWGRNGFLYQGGLLISDYALREHDANEEDCVCLYPITSKGEVSRAARISIPYSALHQVIKELQRLDDDHRREWCDKAYAAAFVEERRDA